jgi:hypothetical protein
MVFPSIDLPIIIMNVWTCVIDLHLGISFWLFNWLVDVGVVLAMNLVTSGAEILVDVF